MGVIGTNHSTEAESLHPHAHVSIYGVIGNNYSTEAVSPPPRVYVTVLAEGIPEVMLQSSFECLFS
jgi:hypothetical protein